MPTTASSTSVDAPEVTSLPRRVLQHPAAVLVTILTCQLMVVLDATVVNVALPEIQKSLRFSPSDLSWVINAYSLTFGGLLLLGARAGDILGRRRVFILGIALFTLASLGGGLADSADTLLIARAVQGIGAALASPSALALLMTAFPGGRERMRAVGLYTAVSVGGTAVGLIVGGMLVQWADWRWVLFVNVPIGIALVALARELLPETTRRRGQLDLPGAITSTVGMAALVFGLVRASTDGWGEPITIGAFGGGVLLLITFVFVELRAESPITPLRLFADRNRSSSYVARLFLVAGMYGMFFFLSQFLQDVLGYGPLKTGLAFLPLTVMVFTASQLSARILVERFGARRVMIGGTILSTSGLLALTRLSETTSYLQLLLTLLLFGLGNGLAFVPLTAASLDGVDPIDAGAASGLVNVMQQVGGALGLAILVTVFGSARSHALAHPVPGRSAVEQAHHAFVYGADHAFWAATILLGATVLIVTFAIRSRPTAIPGASGPLATEPRPGGQPVAAS